MSLLRTIKRRSPLREYNARSRSQSLAKRAVHNHERAIQYGLDFLDDLGNEMDADAKARTAVQVEHRHPPSGWLTEVRLVELDPDKGPVPLLALTAATRQDRLAATDKASATPVSWTTKLATIITEDDGGRFLTTLWTETATEIVSKTHVPAREPGKELWSGPEE